MLFPMVVSGFLCSFDLSVAKQIKRVLGLCGVEFGGFFYFFIFCFVCFFFFLKTYVCTIEMPKKMKNAKCKSKIKIKNEPRKHKIV